MISRIINYPHEQSFFLFGPRGIGKTSWLKSEFNHCLRIDLLEDKTYRELLTSPELLQKRIPSNYKDFIIIDEVQKVPAILDEVHRLIEEKKYKFILSGSSARKLKRSGANLLAGRALKVEMHPFSVLELKEEFDLKKALKVGLIPTIYFRENPEATLDSYIGMYLKEEIIQEGVARRLEPFARFLQSAAFSQAQVINISKVAEDCHLGRKSAEAYFDALEDLLLAVRIPVFSKKAKRKIINHPKFYYVDNGLFQTLRPKGALEDSGNTIGVALETLCLQQIRACRSQLAKKFEVYYWRTQTKHEVDFVLYGESTFIAIEVKSSDRLRTDDYKSLELFGEDYPKARRVLIYAGKEKRFYKDIEVIPLSEFFSPAFMRKL